MYDAAHLGDVTKQAMVVITERVFRARPDMAETEKQKVRDALRKIQNLEAQPPD